MMPLGMGASVILTPLLLATNKNSSMSSTSSVKVLTGVSAASSDLASAAQGLTFSIGNRVELPQQSSTQRPVESQAAEADKVGFDVAVIAYKELGFVPVSSKNHRSHLVTPSVVVPPPPSPLIEPQTQVVGASGIGSWYASPPGTCASPWIPFGTRVTINSATGVTSCVVDDRGPYVTGRILDMSPYTFSQLDSLGRGVLWIHITW